MKNTKLTDTNYLFLSTTVACLENSLIRGETLAKLVDAKDFDDSLRLVTDIYSQRGEIGAFSDDYEKMLSAELARAYAEIDSLLESSGGERELLSPLRTVYDCHNLKSCIKCEALGLHADGMLVSCGNFAPADICEMVRNRDFSVLPEALAQAVVCAIEEFSATGDPQKVDIIIDKGAFLQMRAICEKIGLPYLSSLCGIKADMCNVMTFVRAVRAGIGKDLLSEMLQEGGRIPLSYFLESFDGKTEKLCLGLGAYYDGFEENDAASLSALEKKCDGVYLSYSESIWMSAFGPEKPVMYMIQKENEIRNVRIVLSGKKAGLSAETIRERLRVAAR